MKFSPRNRQKPRRLQADPLQAALLKEFLAQEFLVPAQTPVEPKPILPPVLEPKLDLEFEFEAKPELPREVAPVAKIEAPAAQAATVATVREPEPEPQDAPEIVAIQKPAAALEVRPAATIESTVKVEPIARVEPSASLPTSDSRKSHEVAAQAIAPTETETPAAQLPEAARPSRTLDIDELLANFGAAKSPLSSTSQAANFLKRKRRRFRRWPTSLPMPMC